MAEADQSDTHSETEGNNAFSESDEANTADSDEEKALFTFKKKFFNRTGKKFGQRTDFNKSKGPTNGTKPGTFKRPERNANSGRFQKKQSAKAAQEQEDSERADEPETESQHISGSEDSISDFEMACKMEQKQGKCWNCDQPGHWMMECLKPLAPHLQKRKARWVKRGKPYGQSTTSQSSSTPKPFVSRTPRPPGNTPSKGSQYKRKD